VSAFDGVDLVENAKRGYWTHEVESIATRTLTHESEQNIATVKLIFFYMSS
jgi:hypothetical protein